MPFDQDIAADEFGRAFSAVFKAARSSPDLADLWRAFSELHADEIARRRDIRARSDDGTFPEDGAPPAAAGNAKDRWPAADPTVSATRVNTLFSSSAIRFGLRWQELLRRRVPPIRMRLDDYRAEEDPSPELRWQLVDEVRALMRELGEFAVDQGRELQERLTRLELDLLPERPDRPLFRNGKHLRLTRRKRETYSLALKAAAAATGTPDAGTQKSIVREHTQDVERLRERILRDWRRTGVDPAPQDLLNWVFDSDAKYLRPVTIFSCYRAMENKPVPEWLITSAQVIEMCHNVTLIIDDIVDESETRRGKATLWKRAGDKLTAYMIAGYIVADGYDILAQQTPDELIDLAGVDGSLDKKYEAIVPGAEAPDATRSKLDKEGLIRKAAFERIERCGPVRYDIRLVSELFKRLAVAECMQWKYRKQPLRVEDWRYLAREDTGSMFEICAAIGGRTQRMRRFGRLLGMVYHGCDDVADLRDVKERGLGGGGLEDLKDGILTLPASLAIQENDRVREIFCKAERSKKEHEQLHEAFIEQLDAAEEELDRLAAEAIAEAGKVGAVMPEYLEALVHRTRKLSGRAASE
ncbi:MAG: polyprenyl synthetase family protein [Burkholderiales bacterium]